MTRDHWSEGYRAGMAGQGYIANPYEGAQGETAWAFGCSEGMKARNRAAFDRLLDRVQA